MTILEFKALHKLESLPIFESKNPKSRNKYWGVLPDGSKIISSTKEGRDTFDPSKPTYVYSGLVKETKLDTTTGEVKETGNMVTLHVLSNNVATAAFTL